MNIVDGGGNDSALKTLNQTISTASTESILQNEMFSKIFSNNTQVQVRPNNHLG